MMTVIKQEVMDEPTLPADSMQKVPSLSDLSDADSSLGKYIRLILRIFKHATDLARCNFVGVMRVNAHDYDNRKKISRKIGSSSIARRCTERRPAS